MHPASPACPGPCSHPPHPCPPSAAFCPESVGARPSTPHANANTQAWPAWFAERKRFVCAKKRASRTHCALSSCLVSSSSLVDIAVIHTHTRALHTRHVLSTSPSFIVSCTHSALARRDACHRHCNDLYPRIHVPLRLLARAQATLQLHRTKVHRRSHAHLVVVHGQVVGHQHKGGRCPMHLAARPHRALA